MAIDQITTGIIKNDAVTADKIVAGAVVADVADDSITYAKMQDTSTANRVLGAAGAGTIAEVQVATAMIAADAVDGTKLADNAVNSAHYTDGSIDTVHIADNQITLAKVADEGTLSQSAIKRSLHKAWIMGG